jgi:Lrp/AsnC family transcriptional regulator for asnA, asnC and gidA
VDYPDQTDRDIISRLQYNGRTPFTDIADELGISEASVRRRVKRLTESGVMQIVAIAEPRFLGLNGAGMIGVSVQAGHVDDVAQQIASFPQVTYLFMASGGFDLFVEVYCQTKEEFVDFLSQKLQKVPGVLRTETFMILKMYKLSYKWGQSEPPRMAHRPFAGAENSAGTGR